MNIIDRRFSELAQEIGALGEKELYHRIRREFDRVHPDTRRSCQDFFNRFGFWGRLDPNSGVFEQIELKAQALHEHLPDFVMLMGARGGVISKDRIIEKVWGFDSDAEDRHVEVYISFLRKKLKALGTDTSIETVRGMGYALRAERETPFCPHQYGDAVGCAFRLPSCTISASALRLRCKPTRRSRPAPSGINRSNNERTDKLFSLSVLYIPEKGNCSFLIG